MFGRWKREKSDSTMADVVRELNELAKKVSSMNTLLQEMRGEIGRAAVKDTKPTRRKTR